MFFNATPQGFITLRHITCCLPCLLVEKPPMVNTATHSVWRWSRLWCHTAQPQNVYTIMQKCHSYTGNLNSETPGDSKNAFTFWRCFSDSGSYLSPVTTHSVVRTWPRLAVTQGFKIMFEFSTKPSCVKMITPLLLLCGSRSYLSSATSHSVWTWPRVCCHTGVQHHIWVAVTQGFNIIFELLSHRGSRSYLSCCYTGVQGHI